MTHVTIDKLEQALATPVQEPRRPEFFAELEYNSPDWDVFACVYRRRADATPELVHREQLPRQAPVQEPVALEIIRKWPEGFQERLQHVWLDVVSFIPNVKLYDLQRVLAEFGFTMKLYEGEALAAQPAPSHPDDLAVDRFAAAMKAKMAKQRAKGYGGWDKKDECSTERLQTMLAEHLAKGDPVDVGNLAMMLWNRGESTTPPAHGITKGKR